MATIPELLDGHITLEVECLDRLYLNGYIGKLATGPGLVFFMREQLGKPIPSPVVLGQISEGFREAVKALAEQEAIPVYQFRHKEKKDDLTNEFRRQRPVRDAIVFIGVAQEKSQAFQGRKINGQFPAVTADGKKAPGLKFGQPRVMALLLALTLFQHLIDGFRNHDLRKQVADLLGVTMSDYTPHQMTYDLRRLRVKGLIYRPPGTHRYFVTPYGWKVARLFSRLEARVFRPAIAMFTSNDAVLPFPLRQALDRVDAQLDLLIYEAFPLPKAG